MTETATSAIMASVLRRTRGVLLNTAAIPVEAVERFEGDVPSLDIHHVTAVAGLGAPLGVLTAFTFDPTLLTALFDRFTADIEVPEGQDDVFERETAAEIVNLVLGMCSGDFPDLGKLIVLTPPAVLDGARTIDRRQDATFGSMRLRTPSGIMNIHLLRPHHLFDSSLNYKEAL